MTEKSNYGGVLTLRKKYTPAFKAECVRQQAIPSRTEREQIKRLEPKRRDKRLARAFLSPRVAGKAMPSGRIQIHTRLYYCKLAT